LKTPVKARSDCSSAKTSGASGNVVEFDLGREIWERAFASILEAVRSCADDFESLKSSAAGANSTPLAARLLIATQARYLKPASLVNNLVLIVNPE
jgi:hypothetical protein